MPDRNTQDEPIVIKKYANRRLYNTATASFVRLDDLHRMVKDGELFVVRDEKTGRDITASVLAQIIAEEETRGHSVLPHQYLRQVLKAYSGGVGPQLAAYLERSMEAFASHQQSVARQMGEMLDPGTAFDRMADMSPAQPRGISALPGGLRRTADAIGGRGRGHGTARTQDQGPGSAHRRTRAFAPAGSAEGRRLTPLAAQLARPPGRG